MASVQEYSVVQAVMEEEPAVPAEQAQGQFLQEPLMGEEVETDA